MSDDGFGLRLSALQGNDSERNFARSLNLSQSAYRRLKAGGLPSLPTLLAIADTLGVDLRWLATGEGPKYRSPPVSTTANVQAQSQSQFALSEMTEPGFSVVKRLDVRASAGTGAHNGHEEPAGLLAFRSDWLRRRGINPDFAHALTAKGDSMEPTIRDGDILLVDTSIDHIKDNAIYVVVYGGMLLVKRINVRRDMSITLISDNKQIYPPEDVPADEAADVRIAGRVMWFGRSI